jgi:hypothetical protein
MSCSSTTTTSKKPCVHPFTYIFEIVKKQMESPGNTVTAAEALDRLLDKGIVNTNCNLCCPDCCKMYSLASVETQLKLFEAIFISSEIDFPCASPCCSNVFASVETYLKYAEVSLGVNNVLNCCNGFTECVDDILCWAGEGQPNFAEIVDRILDKGIAEYGTFDGVSQLCFFKDLLQEVNILGPSNSTVSEIIDRILDKGITVYCNQSGEIIIASVETQLKFVEATLGGGGGVPALPNSSNTTTTTTTIPVVIEETTTIPVVIEETTTASPNV